MEEVLSAMSSALEFIWDSQKTIQQVNDEHSVLSNVAVITGSVVSTGGILLHVIRGYMGRVGLDAWHRERVNRYFDAACTNSTMTVNRLVEDMWVNLTNLINVPTTKELRASMANASTREEKLQLWDRCKILTVTRLVASVYARVLLSVFLRVQVVIASKYMFISSLNDTHLINNTLSDLLSQVPKGFELDSGVQLAFLNYSDFIVREGVQLLAHAIEHHATTVLATYPVTRELTHLDLVYMFESIRNEVEKSTGMGGDSLLNSFLLPIEHEDEQHSTYHTPPQLTALLNESRNTMETKEFNEVVSECLEDSFSRVYALFLHNFEKGEESSDIPGGEGEGEGEGEEGGGGTASLPMVRIIPHIQCAMDTITSSSTTNNVFEHLDTPSTSQTRYLFDLFTSY